jgi:hypothetical protein
MKLCGVEKRTGKILEMKSLLPWFSKDNKLKWLQGNWSNKSYLRRPIPVVG